MMKVISRMINKSIVYRISKRTPLIKLMADYSYQTGHKLDTLRFVYDDGTCITKRHTSGSLGIENGDTVFCFKLKHKVIKE